ncbi:OmpH family outer membrane protein [Planctomicrobium sp. SH664]|uniref:OmpH family outer membrane protein n=1 Tax=Planctomicrobium sp. SH664 TaxID=3448125 RepID=UPI003F5B5846
MKKLSHWLVGTTLVAGLALTNPSAYSADNTPAAASSSANPVGLIDMAHVFKNYQKFKTMTEELQKELEQSDQEARGKVEKFKQLQSQLQTLQEGSPDFVKIEGELLQAQTALETFKRNTQREFLRKEADIYKTVYLEVEDAVQRYARFYKYAVVLRFSRQSVDDAENPRDIINGMNRQVLYHRPQDDLTDPILTYLNDEWAKRVGAPPATTSPSGVKPAAGTSSGKTIR